MTTWLKINWLETKRGGYLCLYISPFFCRRFRNIFLFPFFNTQMFFIIFKDAAWSCKKKKKKGEEKKTEEEQTDFSILISFCFRSCAPSFLFVWCIKMHHVIIISPSGAENYFDYLFFFFFVSPPPFLLSYFKKILSSRCQSIYEEFPDYIFQKNSFHL